AETGAGTKRAGIPQKCVCPANRVLDRVGLIPPKGGPDHDPRQAARGAERTPVAAVDRSLAGERVERPGVLRAPPARRAELLCLAQEVDSAGRGGPRPPGGPGPGPLRRGPGGGPRIYSGAGRPASVRPWT